MDRVPKLEYDPERHEYRLDGRPIPSVTQVLRGIGLISDRYPPEAALRGTYVAEATAYDDAGQLDYEGLDPRLRGYVDAWRKFRAEASFQPSYTEYMVYRQGLPLDYAGRIDRIGHTPVTKEQPIADWVIDIKTGEPERWHELQVTAYAACLPTAHRRGLVYLRPDGTYKLVEIVSPHHYATWLACLQVYRFLHGDKHGRQ